MGVGFAGINLDELDLLFGTHPIPPDTMGAIGPNHFTEIINGGVAVYSRTGVRASIVTTESFFDTGGGHPVGAAFDPQVIYDRRSGRWIASALELNAGSNNGLMLAVSATSDPTGTWTKYYIPDVKVAGKFTDFDTLGCDDNGVYIGMVLESGGSASARIAALRKAPLLAGVPGSLTVYVFDVADMRGSPQPAHNMDAVSSSAPAWFVSSVPSATGNVAYCTLTWAPSAPVLSAVSQVTTAGYAAPLSAPVLGSIINIDAGTDRIQNAVIRNGRLWTARTVGVNSTGGAASADRTGCEWIELDVSQGSAASLVQMGRVFDTAASNPRFYYYPAIVVNGQGNAALGFSGSKAAEYAAAYTCGRVASDPAGTMRPIALAKAGESSYLRTDGSGRNRWGNYSHTTVDPLDDMTIWTIQEYAASPSDTWGTWIASLPAPAPTLDPVGGPAAAGRGLTGVSLTLTGTGLYDTDASFANRFQAAISGDGISNLLVTLNGPTSVTLTFDVAEAATASLRNVTVTNPDGQTATLTGAINVGPAATTLVASPATGTINKTTDLQATLTRTADALVLTGHTVRFKVDGTTVGTALTDGTGTATYAYTIPDALGSGAHTITAEFDGTALLAAGSDTASLDVNKATFGFSLYAVSGAVGQTVTLKSLMMSSGQPVVGRTVTFSVDDIVVGTAVSDATGVAFGYTIPAGTGLGGHTVTVAFPGDSAYFSASKSGAVLTVKKTFGFSLYAANGIPGQSVTLKALMMSSGTPVVGRTVTFSVDGHAIGTAVSDATGVSRAYTIPASMALGVHDITVSFAGDSTYMPASRTGSVLTVKAPVAFSLYAATGVPGQTVTLRSLMLSAGQPVIGRSVLFSIDGHAVKYGVSDATGVSITYTIPLSMSLGVHDVTVSFAGDSTYAAGSRTTAALTVGVPKANVGFSLYAVSGSAGQTVTLKSLMLSGGSAVIGRTVQFSVDGVPVGSAVSDATGVSLSYTIPGGTSLGLHNVTVSFAGDASYNPATRTTAALTVN